MKVYIAGKIGEEHPGPETLAKFKAAEDMLLKKGYEVFNPTTSGLGEVADEAVLKAKAKGHETTWYAEILKLDLEALSFCDAVYFMGDFYGSLGATAEYHFAMAIKKRCIFENRYYASDHLIKELINKIRNNEIELSPNYTFNEASKAYWEKHKVDCWWTLIDE